MSFFLLHCRGIWITANRFVFQLHGIVSHERTDILFCANYILLHITQYEPVLFVLDAFNYFISFGILQSRTDHYDK